MDWMPFLLPNQWYQNTKGSSTEHTHTAVLRPFVRDCWGGPVPEETFTYSHMKSSSSLYRPPPSATIHSILPAQTTCFTVSLHNFYPSPFRSTLWSRILHYILRTFLHQIIIFFSQHMIT